LIFEYLDTNFTSRANIKIETVGIEIDEERAYHAKSMSKLDTIVHGNLNDYKIPSVVFSSVGKYPFLAKFLANL
jgi:hypothetical protein